MSVQDQDHSRIQRARKILSHQGVAHAVFCPNAQAHTHTHAHRPAKNPPASCVCAVLCFSAVKTSNMRNVLLVKLRKFHGDSTAAGSLIFLDPVYQTYQCAKVVVGRCNGRTSAQKCAGCCQRRRCSSLYQSAVGAAIAKLGTDPETRIAIGRETGLHFRVTNCLEDA